MSMRRDISYMIELIEKGMKVSKEMNGDYDTIYFTLQEIESLLNLFYAEYSCEYQRFKTLLNE